MPGVAQRFGETLAGLGALREHRAIRTALVVLRWGVVLSLLAYVLTTLHGLGWTAIREALPARWTFYAAALLIFLVQPFADLIIYRRLWGLGAELGPSVMMRKRFFNFTVLDYSGEAWLFAWARRHMPGREVFILHTIKDNNVLSASASLIVLALLTGFLFIAVPQRIALSDAQIATMIALASVTLVPLMAYLVLRKRITTLSVSELAFVFAVHICRVLLNNGLVVLMWSQGLSGAPLLSLLELLALRLVMARLPFLGSKDLVFLGTSLGLAGAIDLPRASVAAVLLAALTVDQMLNLICVGLPYLAGALRDLLRRRAAAE